MSFLGNLLWFCFGGFFSFLSWFVSGILWSLTIIGIPYGKQCFKFASLSLAPFGREVVYGGKTISFLANVIWMVFFGLPMALEHIFFGILWYLTIVGIPFGLQFFKLAKLSLCPFGSEIV